MSNEHASALGKLGGKKSVESRFKGKTKAEISKMMRKVRYFKREIKEMDTMGKEVLNGLNLSQSSKK